MLPISRIRLAVAGLGSMSTILLLSRTAASGFSMHRRRIFSGRYGNDVATAKAQRLPVQVDFSARYNLGDVRLEII